MEYFKERDRLRGIVSLLFVLFTILRNSESRKSRRTCFTEAARIEGLMRGRPGETDLGIILPGIIHMRVPRDKNGGGYLLFNHI